MSKFKIGDRVRLVSDVYPKYLIRNNVYTIINIIWDKRGRNFSWLYFKEAESGFCENYFVLSYLTKEQKKENANLWDSVAE